MTLSVRSVTNSTAGPLVRTEGMAAFVRLTDLRLRIQAEFGPAYADSFARDFVMSELGGRTVEQALAAGVDPRIVWRAVCVAMEIPPARS